MKFSFRMLSFLAFLACAGAMAFALYLEHYQGYEPCPMCIFQRICMVAAGVVFLAGALHGPRTRAQWAYAILAALAALAGAAIAWRHVWLQGLPPDQVPACGPTLDYLLGIFSWSEVVQMVLKGDGNCAKIDAEFLGLSLPFWTMLGFFALAAWALVMPLVSRRRDPRELA